MRFPRMQLYRISFSPMLRPSTTSAMHATSIYELVSDFIDLQHSLIGGCFVPPKLTHSAAN